MNLDDGYYLITRQLSSVTGKPFAIEVGAFRDYLEGMTDEQYDQFWINIGQTLKRHMRTMGGEYEKPQSRKVKLRLVN